MSLRFNHEPGYVLHTRPYKESSLLIDVFTRHHGRFMLLAKGARRVKRSQRGIVMPFKPLLFSWSGRGQLPVMTAVEATAHIAEFNLQTIQSGCYINELVLKMLHRYDEHAVLFDHYDVAIHDLASGIEQSSVLRIFEKQLLKEAGFGLILDHDSDTGAAIESEASYCYLPEQGPIRETAQISAGLNIDGKTLLALEDEQFPTDRVRTQARQLTRALIARQLDGKPLRSRNVLQQVLRYRNL